MTKSKQFFRKLFTVINLVILLSVTLMTSVAFAQTASRALSYAGQPVDMEGNPITTTQVFRFSLWREYIVQSADISPEGNINTGLPTYGGWFEIHTLSPNASGVFATRLAEENPLPEVDLTDGWYVQVEVKAPGAPNSSYQTIDPTGMRYEETDFTELPEELLPAAPEEPEFEESLLPDVINETTDETPVIAAELEPNTEYEIVITDENGNVIERITVMTDAEGRLVYVVNNPLTGQNTIQIINKATGEIARNYTIRIVSRSFYPDFNVTNFGGKKDLKVDAEGNIQVGEIARTPGKPLVIQGLAAPYPCIEILAYFESEVRLVKVRPDKDGRFQVEIPEELDLGAHSVKIFQRFPDKVISEQINYYFTLVPAVTGAEEMAATQASDTKQNAIIVSSSILVILVGLYLFFSYKNKKLA